MSEIKDLFFDLDNTLLDFSYASQHAFAGTLKHFGKEAEGAYEIYGEGNSAVWSDFEKGLITAEKLRGKRFQVFLDRMGWDGNGDEWNARYIECVVKHTRFVDGAYDLLEGLKHHFSLHIVTNGLREAQRPRLKEARIYDHFTSITVSDEIGHAKPQADFFKVAMDNARIKDKQDVLMIGDSYNSDIQGGHNYGLKTCWFNPGHKKVNSEIHDFEIHKIKDLKDLLH